MLVRYPSHWFLKSGMIILTQQYISNLFVPRQKLQKYIGKVGSFSTTNKRWTFKIDIKRVQKRNFVPINFFTRVIVICSSFSFFKSRAFRPQKKNALKALHSGKNAWFFVMFGHIGRKRAYFSSTMHLMRKWS